MTEHLDALRASLAPYPWAYTVVVACALVLLAWLANWITKRVLLRGLRRLLATLPLGQGDQQVRLRVIPRLANVVPAVVLAAGVAFVPDLPALLVTVVRNVCFAFIILTVALAVAAALCFTGATLRVAQAVARRPQAPTRPTAAQAKTPKLMPKFRCRPAKTGRRCK